MADDKKPDDFAKLMRRMGETKQFPIDLQPINPAAPLREGVTPSKELQEMREEEVTAQPSLAGMLEGVDLEDVRVKRFFAKLLAEDTEKPKKE